MKSFSVYLHVLDQCDAAIIQGTSRRKRCAFICKARALELIDTSGETINNPRNY